MVAATLTAFAEAAKDCRVLVWNVRNMCETSACSGSVGMVIVILTVLFVGLFSSPIG